MHSQNRPLFQKVVSTVAVALIGCSLAPYALADDAAKKAPTTAPGFSEALPLMPAGAPATPPADIDKAVLEGVVIPAAPTTTDAKDPAIADAAAAYRKMFENARQAGLRPTQADMGDYADAALAKWTLSKLSLPQIAKLLNNIPVTFAPKTAKELDGILTELSKATDADGAKAAIVRLQLAPFNVTPAIRAERVEAVLSHPGLSGAVANGDGAPLFATASSLEADALKATAPKFNALASSFKGDAPAAFYDTAARFQLAVGHALNSDDLKAFEPFRAAAAATAAERLKGSDLGESEKTRLQTAVDQLNGAFARGDLIGHDAPKIDFLAFTDPANPDKKITSLADLKGKVVVLDFWATWCGPCIASFPKVKALNRYYRGFDVVVVGVTSPQGFVVIKGAHVDTENDLAKEITLINTDFTKEKEVSWPIAVSKQNVFNPDFGITGIPSVAIIDAEGKVRYAGLHPAQPLEEKTKLIDGLLAEAKLPLPAIMMGMKPPAAAEKAEK